MLENQRIFLENTRYFLVIEKGEMKMKDKSKAYTIAFGIKSKGKTKGKRSTLKRISTRALV